LPSPGPAARQQGNEACLLLRYTAVQWSVLQCVLQCGLQCVLQCEKVMNGIKRDLDFALIESRVTMGWLRSVGSIKLSVSFAEYSVSFIGLFF